MSSSSNKPLIFISYARADEPPGSRVKWLSFVMEFLAPAVVGGQFTMWVDRQMTGGAIWEKEIEEKIRACDIFVLLVSPKSMASTFIIETEIKIARERQAGGDELHVFPLLLRPTPKAGLDRVRDFNLRPRDAKPFSAYPLNGRERQMTEAANEIACIAKAIEEKKAAAAAEQERKVAVDRGQSPIQSDMMSTASARQHGPAFYVSYAWGEEGDPKQNAVDRLRAETGRRNVDILTSKKGPGRAELISDFMQRIGQGDRIVIFLSDKYLRSLDSMGELLELWRLAKQKNGLLQRIGVFTIDQLKIGTWEQLEYAKYWREARDNLLRVIDVDHAETADEEATQRLRLMDQLADNVSDILAMFRDIVQPRTFEDFLRRGFDEASETNEASTRPKAATQHSTISRVPSAGSEAARTALPTMVATTGLPETGYERLVGRDAELERLDQAWDDDKTNILSLIAEGGAGKSALVNEWLTRLRADSYRGAERVLGWSFYSQGSKERATAADAFLGWALDKLGVQVETTSASTKGEAIAEALMTRHVLLVLDGVEPLQHGPGPQPGQLKDQGLRALLRRFAAAPPKADHSLIVLTSRVAVADIQLFRNGAAPVIDVERLSDEAGAELLRDNDVWGIDKELRAASRDFGGHPLALTLLASLLKETQNGDVRRRDHIRGLLADADDPRHGHAKRVMESYEKGWLANQPALLAILHCVGLFDRPASRDCLKALRAKPKIPGLTDALVGLSDEQWRRCVERLRDVRLLAPRDKSDPEALDAHPLVREWFGERARLTNEAGWKAAHSRLYDHLRRTTREGSAPTLAYLAPLYHAIAHGCRAGRQQATLDDVYKNRICRRLRDGQFEFYSGTKLGAMGSNLAAISWFFDRPYETPSDALAPSAKSWVLNQASIGLRAQGRLQEALPAMSAGLRMEEAVQDWRNAAVSASNLSETELLVGEISSAVATAQKSILLAKRSGDAYQIIVNCVIHAGALLANGDWGRVARIFSDAEQRQQELQPSFPLLYSTAGYLYCDFLLSQGQAAAARDRSAQTLPWAREQKFVLSVAVDALTLGRAHLALALQIMAKSPLPKKVSAETHTASARLEEAVERLRASERDDQVPRGHIARAAFRRAIADWDGAKRDLNEVKEIAESGQMRLYWCDCALEGARLALARREAFAPLNGFVESSPPPPVLPDADTAAALREEARKELDVARKLIAECGYHRRDEELAELDAVITGGRRFADLPPRV